jgi:hypothetical protein
LAEVIFVCICINNMVKITSGILEATISATTDLELYTFSGISPGGVPVYEFDMGIGDSSQLDNLTIQFDSDASTVLSVTLDSNLSIPLLYGSIGAGSFLKQTHLSYDANYDNTLGGKLLEYAMETGLKFPFLYRTVYRDLIVDYQARITELNAKFTAELDAVFSEAQAELEALILANGGTSYTVTATDMSTLSINSFLMRFFAAIFDSVRVYTALAPLGQTLVDQNGYDQSTGVIDYSGVVNSIITNGHTVGVDMFVTFSGLKIGAQVSTLPDILLSINIVY